MEVVLANGEVVTTGGMSELCPTRYTYKWGVGPFVDGLFAQSNLGIVTKAGLWLMPKPEIFQMFVIQIPHIENLAQAIDALRELALRRVVKSCHGFNQFLALTRTSGYPTHLLHGKKCLSETDIAQLGLEHGLASWTIVGGIYGTSRQVRANKMEIKKHLSSLGRLVFFDDTSQKILKSMVHKVRSNGFQGTFFRGLKSLSDLIFGKASIETIESLLSLYPILKGEPNEQILVAAYVKNKERQPAKNLDPARDECGLIFFAPLVPARGKEVQSLVENIKQICANNQFESGILLIQPNPRTFFVVLLILYNRENAEETQRAQQTYDQLCEFLEPLHYQQYRCCTPQMEKILDYNQPYQRLMKALKVALDPNQIIAPGRYGV